MNSEFDQDQFGLWRTMANQNHHKRQKFFIFRGRVSSLPVPSAHCQREIDQVSAGGRFGVSFEDRHQMPFVMATVHETVRLANIAPLGVFHATTRDTHLQGYRIPQVGNMWKISAKGQDRLKPRRETVPISQVHILFLS